MHPPIEQVAVLLTRARANPAAVAFHDFLFSEDARRMIPVAGREREPGAGWWGPRGLFNLMTAGFIVAYRPRAEFCVGAALPPLYPLAKANICVYADFNRRLMGVKGEACARPPGGSWNCARFDEVVFRW